MLFSVQEAKNILLLQRNFSVFICFSPLLTEYSRLLQIPLHPSEKSGKGVFLSLTRQIIFLLPLLIILPIFMGIDGVMYSAPVADGIAAVFSAWFMWKEFKIIDKQMPN